MEKVEIYAKGLTRQEYYRNWEEEHRKLETLIEEINIEKNAGRRLEMKVRFEYYPKQNQLYDKINDELYCLGIKQDKTRLVDFLNLMNEDWWTLYERNKELREENQQLKQQLVITEKTLELACEHIKEDLKCDDTENEIYNYFKTQAREMLENENKI